MGEAEAAAVDWVQIVDLVGPMAGSVLAMVLLVVPIVYALVRFLEKLLKLLQEANERNASNDVKTARILERLTLGIASMSDSVASKVAEVMHHDRANTLDSGTILSYKRAAMQKELDAASLISDAGVRRSVEAEIRAKYQIEE